MNTRHKRSAVVVTSLVLAGLLGGCTSTKQEAPTTTTTPTTTTPTSTPSVTPTEHDLDPSGANKFTPTHIVTPPPPTGGQGEHFQ
ncbi:ABC-type uncharacterized transport system auxiliary subunit [Mycobacterium sp. MAA66]|uniref:hypothetical protein n=1 Tax=Mycobacterium sp. MAA66 TaxID=3156297 RepID=UPI003514D6EC